MVTIRFLRRFCGGARWEPILGGAGAGSASVGKVMKARLDPGRGQLQNGQRDRQVEAPRPGASRIEVEHAAASLDHRSMRVAGDDDIDAARCGVEIELVNVVQDMDSASAECNGNGVRVGSRPGSCIDIPPDCRDRRNPTKAIDDVGTTDVAGVNDVRDAREASLGLRAKQTMRIGDDADLEHELMSSVALCLGILGFAQACRQR